MVYIVFNLVERSAITSHLSLLRSQFFPHLSGDPTFVSSNAESQAQAGCCSCGEYRKEVSLKFRDRFQNIWRRPYPCGKHLFVLSHLKTY